MRVAALQLAHHFGQPDRALAAADRLLTDAGPVDLALLPEACLTGYVSTSGDFDLTAQAEPLDGPSFGRLAALARQHMTTLVAPLIERAADGRCHNAYVVLDATGALVAHYRKRHPWFPEEWATAGDAPYPRLHVAGRRLTLAVCFDIHFVSDEAGELLDEVDVLLFPSAWVDDRRPDDTRSDILPALATRHRIAIVNANWARSAPRLPGQGGSRILDPHGRPLATAPGDAACAVVAAV